ncbi:MAG: formylglycine-generating enzyme family protein [Deltaproteobacteria bacterium]|nr:formylglycine-generating enzyme family protein [Deltaproteobacteria bacterium]
MKAPGWAPGAAVVALLGGPLLAQPAPRVAVTPPAPDRVRVSAGGFTMGTSTAGEPDERPAHHREVAEFFLDRTEVTRGSYQRCVRAGVCEAAAARPTFRDPSQPVVNVSWFMARAYCAWAGGRLPTEPEGEKAARGTDGRTWPWGNDPPTPSRAVYGQRMSVGSPARVGERPSGASPYGALDLAGNVWEWTETVYDPYAYTRPGTEPTCATALAAFTDLRRRNLWAFTGAMGIPSECQRVLRGGAWNYWPDGLRATNRVHHEPRGRYPVSGFRCAADPPGR